MKLFLDTADLKEIEYFADLGLLDGVTTNPSLLAGLAAGLPAGQNYTSVVKDICSIMSGKHVSLEVIATDYAGMVKEGMKLRELSDDIVVKLPLTADGLKACRHFASKQIPTNLTLCFSATQALLAAKAGATCVSVFVGRQDDLGEDGMSIVADILDIYENYPDISEGLDVFPTEVLVASIRSVAHVAQAAKIGADICTMPPKIMRQMFVHPLTQQGIDKFLADWNQAKTIG